VNKAQIVNRLAAVHGYRHYLELCTRTTGRQYAEIDRSLLTTCKRLMYRCLAALVTEWKSTTGPPISTSPNASARSGAKIKIFDIALIDPFHEYGTSWRDIDEGFMLGSPHEQRR
jgi:hypothetical protein